MHQIVWTNKAISSLSEVIDFVIKRNQSNTYAEKILDEIERKEKLLSNTPLIGVQIEDFPTKNLRKINILGNFSMIYRVYNSSFIDIIYFWDNRQNPKKLEIVLK